MNQKKKLLTALPFHAAMLAVSVLSPVIFYATRAMWVFVDNTLKIKGFTFILLALMILTALFYTFNLYLRVYKVKKNDSFIYEMKGYRISFIVFLILTSVLFIFSLAYSLGIATAESSEVYFLYLKESLPVFAVLTSVGFLSLFSHALSCKWKKIIISLIIIGFSIFTVNSLYPLTPYKITSHPVVIDNGKEYSVVFSTNRNGTGYIEYTFEGKNYKIFDQSGGRLRSDKKIHSIPVPYEHLQNNSYTVSSTRVIEQYSYGSRRGKTVKSDKYKFSYTDGENQTFLVISDWHTMLEEAYCAISHVGDYDGVILLGDASPGVDFEEQVVSNVVEFAGEVSKGEKVVLYVRGNHETRGAYANELLSSLGLNSFYHTADIGPYSFVILDSGEDKDDSHSEYGGMTDYNTSRKDMIKWLQGTVVKNDKVIALSHAWEISEVEEDLSQKGFEELDRLGTRLLLSGHLHECRLIGEENEKEKKFTEEYPDITAFVDGGKNADNYIASKLVLTDNKFVISSVDKDGNQVFEKAFKW